MVVPLFGFVASLPNGLLEVGADRGKIEEIGRGEIRKHLAAGDGSGGSDVAESGRDGVIAGGEEIGFPDITGGFEFAMAIAAASSLGEGVEAALGAVNDGE